MFIFYHFHLLIFIFLGTLTSCTFFFRETQEPNAYYTLISQDQTFSCRYQHKKGLLPTEKSQDMIFAPLFSQNPHLQNRLFSSTASQGWNQKEKVVLAFLLFMKTHPHIVSPFSSIQLYHLGKKGLVRHHYVGLEIAQFLGLTPKSPRFLSLVKWVDHLSHSLTVHTSLATFLQMSTGLYAANNLFHKLYTNNGDPLVEGDHLPWIPLLPYVTSPLTLLPVSLLSSPKERPLAHVSPWISYPDRSSSSFFCNWNPPQSSTAKPHTPFYQSLSFFLFSPQKEESFLVIISQDIQSLRLIESGQSLFFQGLPYPQEIPVCYAQHDNHHTLFMGSETKDPQQLLYQWMMTYHPESSSVDQITASLKNTRSLDLHSPSRTLLETHSLSSSKLEQWVNKRKNLFHAASIGDIEGVRATFGDQQSGEQIFFFDGRGEKRLPHCPSGGILSN
jgi:hypothetical protein